MVRIALMALLGMAAYMIVGVTTLAAVSDQSAMADEGIQVAALPQGFAPATLAFTEHAEPQPGTPAVRPFPSAAWLMIAALAAFVGVTQRDKIFPER